ncbi:hypothetical protein CBS147372_8156 [Penicillium roqueforti]|nr:hypothetical protein CBS147372_8156 [Penicillium roqueforti]
MDSTRPIRQRQGASRDPNRAGRATQGAGHDDRQQYHRNLQQQYQHQGQHQHQSMSQSSIAITPACYLCHDPRHLQRRCPLFALWKSAVETLCHDHTIDPMNLLEQIDIGILVTALASALPDRDGDISMQ